MRHCQSAPRALCYTAPVRDDVAPLNGLVVLDLTRVLAGPYCTRLLADLGARVIKIERPGLGDEMRRAMLQLEPDREDQSTYYVRCNAGKESVALDLGHPAAHAVVMDLARVADVVVENFVPGVVARLGCDYETLAAVKPDLVYCSISGYGQTGPWRLRPAFAHLIHAASGMMSLEQGSDPSPRSANLQAADVLAGTHAFGAILAALWRRARTGRGGRLDISMLETLVAADDMSFGSVLNGGPEHGAPRIGMIVKEIDGRHLALQTGGASEIMPRLVALMKRPELLEDPRFSTPAARRDNWIAPPRHHRGLARDLRLGRRRGGRAHSGSRAVRSGADARGGRGASSPGRARVLPHGAAPGAGRSPHSTEPVPARRTAGDAEGRRPLSSR